MVITFNGAPVHLDLDTILIWVLVGLVAGFLASHIALGRGLGLFGDTIVGIIGAFIGGFLAAAFHFSVAVVGQAREPDAKCEIAPGLTRLHLRQRHAQPPDLVEGHDPTVLPRTSAGRAGG